MILKGGNYILASPAVVIRLTIRPSSTYLTWQVKPAGVRAVLVLGD